MRLKVERMRGVEREVACLTRVTVVVDDDDYKIFCFWKELLEVLFYVLDIKGPGAIFTSFYSSHLFHKQFE